MLSQVQLTAQSVSPQLGGEQRLALGKPASGTVPAPKIGIHGIAARQADSHILLIAACAVPRLDWAQPVWHWPQPATI